jgi:Protein of unknown function (DUF3102)
MTAREPAPRPAFDYGQLPGNDWKFIQDARDEIRQLGKQTVEGIVEIGRLLTEVKARLPHGQWLPWLEANTIVSARQSQRYMRLTSATLAGKYDSTSHLTIEGALQAIADQREPNRHPIRDMTPEERRDWFSRFLVDRRSWAVYLDADRTPLADIAAFIGESEEVTRALIRPSVDPGWHWELKAEPKYDPPEARQFHDLTRRVISPLTEYLIQSIRHHALLHAEWIRLHEDRDDLAPVIETLLRECIRRADAAEGTMLPAVALLPRRLVCGLYGASAYLAVDASMGNPQPDRGGLWYLVGQCSLADEPIGASWAEIHAAPEPSPAFRRVAKQVLGASEVLAHVRAPAP